VVIGRRVGGDEERRDPSDDPLAARASAPDDDATKDDHSDDDKPNDRGEGYSELHAGSRRPKGRNIRRFWRPFSALARRAVMPVSRCLRVQYHRGNGGVAGGGEARDARTGPCCSSSSRRRAASLSCQASARSPGTPRRRRWSGTRSSRARRPCGCSPSAGPLYPPDVAESGVDLDALIVVQVPTEHGEVGLARAAELLLRSGAFGLCVVDLSAPPTWSNWQVPKGMSEKPSPRLRGEVWQARLAALARMHASRVVVLTRAASGLGIRWGRWSGFGSSHGVSAKHPVSSKCSQRFVKHKGTPLEGAAGAAARTVGARVVSVGPGRATRCRRYFIRTLAA
jgi:hypothetical protein